MTYCSVLIVVLSSYKQLHHELDLAVGVADFVAFSWLRNRELHRRIDQLVNGTKKLRTDAMRFVRCHSHI
jgi:hypothetical protein